MRRTGYIPDPLHVKRPRYQAVREKFAALPDNHSILAFAPEPFDQNSTGSCTGATISQAIYTSLAAQGKTLDWIPSPDGIYKIGRAIDRVQFRDGTIMPLTDDGAYPNQVFRGVSEWGIRPMGPLVPGYFYDCDPSNVNDEPQLGELEESDLHIIVGEYGITSTGEQRLIDICTSLAANKPVTVAIAGGSWTFQNYSGGIVPALRSPLDHYVWLYGYSTDSKGVRILDGRNSWGKTSWGDNGNFHLSEEAMQELGDIVVVDAHLIKGNYS